MPHELIQGRVWKFGDNISTDLMMPGFTLRLPLQEQLKYCMNANRPGWSEQVEPGDVIVAGANFGCGSSRPAPDVLKGLGISCVLAESFSGIFHRNAVAAGLLVIDVPGVSQFFDENDVAVINPTEGIVTNLSRNTSLDFHPIPEVLNNIIRNGGILEMLLKEYQSG